MRYNLAIFIIFLSGVWSKQLHVICTLLAALGGVSFPFKSKTIWWIHNNSCLPAFFRRRKHFTSAAKKTLKQKQTMLFPQKPGKFPKRCTFAFDFVLQANRKNKFILHSNHVLKTSQCFFFFIVAVLYQQFCLYRYWNKWLNDNERNSR